MALATGSTSSHVRQRDINPIQQNWPPETVLHGSKRKIGLGGHIVILHAAQDPDYLVKVIFQPKDLSFRGPLRKQPLRQTLPPENADPGPVFDFRSTKEPALSEARDYVLPRNIHPLRPRRR